LGGPVDADTTFPSIKDTLASFTVSPQNGTAPLTVTFDASASFSNMGEIASYTWNTGAGDAAGEGEGLFTTTEPFLTYTYEQAGLYYASLEVRVGDMEFDNTTRLVNVSQAGGSSGPLPVAV